MSGLHLWEVDHPYYCGEANYHQNADGSFNHLSWNSWADFRDETCFVTGNRDLNLLVRWDWLSWRRHPNPGKRLDDPDELCLYFVMQRKGCLASHYMTVTDQDEPEVRAFLERCAATVAALWQPLRLPAGPPDGQVGL